MRKKEKVAYELKIEAVERYLSGSCSYSVLAKELSVKKPSVRAWVKTYQYQGPEGLLSKNTNTTYSNELKAAAVKDYMDGNGSLVDIRAKYGLKSHRQLIEWIMKYNGHEGKKSTSTGGFLMNKGRNTTFEERVEIVKYCIEHDNDYHGTAQHYKVSYNQAYSWTHKYERDGIEALQDRRGNRKLEEQMSEVEKLRAQNKLLQAESKRKQMEIDFLKKLADIERRRF